MNRVRVSTDKFGMWDKIQFITDYFIEGQNRYVLKVSSILLNFIFILFRLEKIVRYCRVSLQITYSFSIINIFRNYGNL